MSIKDRFCNTVNHSCVADGRACSSSIVLQNPFLFMRSCFLVLLVLIVSVMLAVPACAIPVPPKPPFDVVDGVDTFSTFITSKMKGEIREHMQQIFIEPADRTLITSCTMGNQIFFEFFIFPADINVKLSENTPYLNMDFYRKGRKDGTGVRSVRFTYNATTKQWNPTYTFQPYDSSAAGTWIHYIYGGTYPIVFGSEAFPKLSYEYFWAGSDGLVAFVDDDGLLSPKEPSEPELPPVVVPPAKLPEIPKGDGKWVLYDTSVWQTFLDYVTQAMGSSTNIGLLIFAMIIGILVVVWIVRRFTR